MRRIVKETAIYKVMIINSTISAIRQFLKFFYDVRCLVLRTQAYILF